MVRNFFCHRCCIPAGSKVGADVPISTKITIINHSHNTHFWGKHYRRIYSFVIKFCINKLLLINWYSLLLISINYS